jgi:DNA gyrase subunit A
MINILPLKQGETITTIMPLPEDESKWDELFVMFATKSGGVRRNKLSDFIQINRSGKIAMKLEDEGDSIIGVQICTENDDVLLTAAGGRSARFPVSEVRVFAGRTSTGVRGIRLDEGDEVIGMTILRHVEVTSAEREAYLKQAAAMRRATLGDNSVDDGPSKTDEEDADDAAIEDLTLTTERYAELGAKEQFVLAVTEKGFGRRSSSYRYPAKGRGGKGVIAMDIGARNGRLIASFPVEDDDQIMLVTDAGQLIRCPVHDISIQARGTQGVTVFRTAADERVVSVERVEESADSEAGDEQE